jgi:hypothetical protein
LRAALAIGAASAVVTACSGPSPDISSSPSFGEQMPGPASIWLTSDPAAPTAPVEVVMTSPDDPDVRFAHTFVAGQALRGSFVTSQGSYAMTAFGGACRLPLVLGPDEAVDVLLTLEPGPGCTLALVRRGRMDDPAMQKSEQAVLITNRDAGAATPFVESLSPSDGP